jgi:hypothetical protein
MRSAIAFVGLGALALVVGQADFSIADAAAREALAAAKRAKVIYVRFSGPRPVRDVAACAHLVGLPAPSPCVAMPCGWVANRSAWAAGSAPYWITSCQVPLQ